MTLPSDWKIGSCLEWYTEVPFPDRPRESPVFLIQNVECSFQFHRKISSGYKPNYYYYNLYLKPKTSDAKLKSFKFAIYCDGSLIGSLSRNDVNFVDSNQCLMSFHEDNIRARGANVGCGYFLNFFFVFGTGDGPSLPLDTKSGDKSVQVSSYNDACFMKDFSKMLDEGPNHDVEFVCGDQTVRAHKNVLCCRSDVFASMLQSDMEEGKTGSVNIEDMDVSVFRRFLKCLYTGMLPELTVDSAFQLYAAADKYCAGGVKKQCADFLTDHLSPEIACDVLVLADRHNDLDFKKDVVEYVVNEKIPYVGEKWTDFCKANPILAVEILNLFCEQFRPE